MPATTIRTTAPFDALAAFGFLTRCRDEPIDIVEGPTLRRALVVDGRPVAVTVTSTGTVDAPRLDVEIDSEAPVAREAVEARIRRMLNTDADPRPFLEACARDPRLRDAARTHRGVRPVGTPTVFEAVIWAITGQHVTLTVACMLKGRLARLFGEEYRGLRAFPTPPALAGADPDVLGQNGFTRAKHGAIIGFAQAVASGAFDPESLRSIPPAEGVAHLIAFKGIGPWTAQYVLARGLADPDAFPLGDVGIRQSVERILGIPRATDAQVLAFAEPFAGHRAWLTFLLWSLL